jgi:hypothetical protein
VSILERLKQEDAAQRQAAEAAARERDARERTYRDQIEPRMSRLVQHMEETARTLISLKPTIRNCMTVAGYGDVTVQPLWDYRLEHERRRREWVLKLSWTWRVDSARSPVVRVDSGAKCRALIAVFRTHQLSGVREEARNRAGDEIVVASFQARGLIRASLETAISVDDPALRMTFTNASWLGTSQRQVPWLHMDDELLDKLVRFLVREDDTLFTEEFTARRETEELPASPAVEAAARPRPAPIETESFEVPMAPAAAQPAAPAAEQAAAPAASESPAPESTSMDDVLGVIPDPTAALIAALGIDDASPEASALSMDDWSRPAPTPAMPVPDQAAQRTAPPRSPLSPRRPADYTGGPPAPSASRPVQPGAATPVGDDFEPLTRTEAALMAKLRRKASAAAPGAPQATTPATPAPSPEAAAASAMPSNAAAALENHRLDAAAFRRRMSGMLSKLREDGSSEGED